MQFFCIADKESSLGFKLAGLETREVSAKAELLEALKVAVSMETVGVIVVTEKAAALGRKEIDDYIEQVDMPLILEIASNGHTRKGISTSNILKEALGIKI